MNGQVRPTGLADASSDLPPVSPPPDRPVLRSAGWVLWPSFLAAALLEVAVFALIDPDAVRGPGGEPLEWSRTAIYSLAFLSFWAATAAAAAVALWLSAGQGAVPERWPGS